MCVIHLLLSGIAHNNVMYINKTKQQNVRAVPRLGSFSEAGAKKLTVKVLCITFSIIHARKFAVSPSGFPLSLFPHSTPSYPVCRTYFYCRDIRSVWQEYAIPSDRSSPTIIQVMVLPQKVFGRPLPTRKGSAFGEKTIFARVKCPR